MPELPEAETIARSLRPLVEGRVITNVEYPGRRVLRGVMPELAGQRIVRVGRHGKRIVLELSRGAVVVSLGMTGALLAGAEPGPYTRAVFTLDAGVLLFDDVRQFGNLRWSERLETESGLGPDPLEMTAREFAERLRARRTRVKPLLLNQEFVRGVGNIYADEALHRAGIDPRVVAARLSRARAERLHAGLVEVLEEAIAHRGSSVSDYVDARGERGGFQALHRVYRREGQPCPRCGAAIRRIVMAQRGTHFCPQCQK
ncbi:MAG: bifunctional DNA-formamidopyrimidine glycosylase/DNA-(apurinic or apyrimidinic site) lyase [Bryobacterales bacterium]|nr:bifunctional DNA-formamidopyrimidine glycosylase/DNA-(apurinic or apyrimidinic site) lyase [Bryobacterales bacterium]